LKKLIISIFFILLGPHVSAQDYNKGYEAYKAGDYAAAMKEWKPLAEQGHVGAQSNLGYMYDTGKGVLQDYSESAKWWRLSAEQGNAQAQYSLGFIYRKGQGVLKNATEAVKWYRLAAEQGNAPAQSTLGFMYEFGSGVLQSNLTAHMWYNIASANGQEKAGEHRNQLADLMTPEDISKATAMARKCMKSNYKKCGD
jgi:uncharacterized protein